MTGFDLLGNFIDDPESLVRKARIHFDSPRRTRPEDKPASFAPSTYNTMAQNTLHEYSAPSADQVLQGPDVAMGTENFEIKMCLVTMVQASPFCGKPNQDANAHL
jgi:hypothetical protein